MKRLALVFTVILLLVSPASRAAEIGFIEDFALAPDRTVPLKQLIPGTEAYYYYHCLHYQNAEQFDKVNELLAAWIKRHKYTSGVREILNRQALLTYEKNPEKSLEYLRQQLGLQFNHQREVEGHNPNLPSALNPKLISRGTLTAAALKRHQNLQGFETRALDWLAETKLTADQRRFLLQRLQRPDLPNLAKLVVDDLNYRYSSGFGSMDIHRNLLRVQLDECLKLKPGLLNQTNFVQTYLTKLRPSDDVDWQHNDEEHVAYLDRLWSFVEKLAPVHNSLKAHVLYHRLVYDRAHGVHDKDRFMAYVQLPRHVSYINSDYMKLEDSKRWPANLQADFRDQTDLPSVGNDEPLVRSYLHHFFVKENSTKPYESYINDIYLKHNFAETKIVNGLGDAEQWYSMLPPEKYQALKERIDLDFAATNDKVFAAADEVSLDVNVKNVKSLIVKVYRINSQNYYRRNLTEVNTDINLDGLVANREETYEYDEPPLRRARRHFAFPELTKPGVYVIDFIGNGKSSRSVVRKGKLRYLVRTSTAGHVFTVMDEQNRKLDGATLWMAGHEYKADDDGTITVPFTNDRGNQAIVLTHDGFSSLAKFWHEEEIYILSAGIYVDRESLLARNKTNVVVRPELSVSGTPVTLSLLEDVTLEITSTDHDGVQTTKEVADFELAEDREAVYEFQTPARLARLQFTLKAKVENLSKGEKVTLSDTRHYELNKIGTTDKVMDLHLAKIKGSYVVDLLGKSGEPLSMRAVHFQIKHRDFVAPVHVSLQTDKQGRIALGELPEITSVTATGPQEVSHTWYLMSDEHTYHHEINGAAGQVISLPYMGAAEKPSRSELALLETCGGSLVADHFDALSIKDGFLHVGKLPRGDFELLLKDIGHRIKLRIAAGPQRDGFVMGDNRQLEVRGDDALQILSVANDDENVTIQLSNSSDFARVHVFATRYQPAFLPYRHLSRVRDSEPTRFSTRKLETLYVAGRNIGDEYRYIIERQYAMKYPGVMLARPSVLLNPWAIRNTETTHQVADTGDHFDRSDEEISKLVQYGGKSRSNPNGGFADFGNLDFLSKPSVSLLNLAPNDDGLITIDRKLLQGHQHVHVVAVDPRSTTYRSLSLPETPSPTRDLRLADGLDAKEHYTQQKQVTVVAPKKEFVLSDIATSKFEAYDTLAGIYALYGSLTHDAKLIEFNFVLRWPSLKPEEKRKLYSKYACHELNFFIFKKDPAFFEEVVQPYLKNKKDKTFLDLWLVEDDLSAFRKPWKYSQLNSVEKVLLAQRIKDEQPYTLQLVSNAFDLIPPNADRFTHLFTSALKGTALDANDDFGWDARKKDEQREAHWNAKTPDAAAPPPALDPAPLEPEVPGFDRPADEKTSGEAKDGEALRKELGDLDGRLSRRGKEGEGGGKYHQSDKNRDQIRQFYRKLDKTQEWVENNYYKLAIEQQNADLVAVNAFWRDYAAHKSGPFLSTNLADASGNFTEMMFALAVLDLPFEAAEHKTTFDETTMKVVAGSPMIVFHEEIKPAKSKFKNTQILVSQNFFRHGDRYRHIDNQRYDKYVDDEFLVHAVYGCQVVVTNPTSSPQKLDLLLQIPEGAIPVLNSQYTRSVHIDLPPYNTQTLDYYFYFPAAGKQKHYPVQVAKNEELIGFAEAASLKVVNEFSKIDRESWSYISQHGSSEDLMGYLKNKNLLRTNLDRIAFRMADKRFFENVTNLLAARHVYNHTLWSYGIKHDHGPAIAQYLQHADGFVNQCGAVLDSRLLTIDPVARKTYQHMDYRPLVNARAHQLGRRRQILNDRFAAQYNRLLKILSYRREFTDDERMAVTYYLLLQDRVEEAIATFERVNVDNLATRLQYDYFTAYLAFSQEDLGRARQIAEKYDDHPVDRWRNAFAAVSSQLDEIDGADVKVVDDDDREQTQTALASSAASFDFTVESKQVAINYQQLDKVVVNYYQMDIELLFSRNPFVQRYTGQFSNIHPNLTQTIELPKDKRSLKFDLPDELHNRNVLVEISGGGQTKSQAYYSHSLSLQLTGNYGQLRVTHDETGKPIPKTYVKVYAQMGDGSVRFYKDGYTDLRGRFDYTSLNTNELDNVSKFSLLVLSDDHGAIVREADPPKR